jgi:hypothetical protein
MIDYTKSIDFALVGLKQFPLTTIFLILDIPLLLCAGAAMDHSLTQPNAIPIAISVATMLCIIPAVLLRWICNARVSVNNGHLSVRTSIGTKRIRLANLREHGVLTVNLTEHPELRPRRRLWATFLPGLNSGWFYLNNREKAFGIVLDHRHVTYLRSDADKLSILLSLRNPELLCALIARAT